MLCCAVLCCAVLCCAVLCCAVLCCAVLCCAGIRCEVCTYVFPAFVKIGRHSMPFNSFACQAYIYRCGCNMAISPIPHPSQRAACSNDNSHMYLSPGSSQGNGSRVQGMSHKLSLSLSSILCARESALSHNCALYKSKEGAA